MELTGIHVRVDVKTGKTLKIERIRVIDNELADLFASDNTTKK